MTHKLLAMTTLLLFLEIGYSAEGIHFDQHGKIIAPDQQYLEKGIEAQALGYNNDAMVYLKKAAKYGNTHAQAVIGLIHIKDKQYSSALAWFNLIDQKMIPNNDMLKTMIVELEAKLSAHELEISNQLNAELRQTFGKHAALLHREKWQKNLSFGGTHVKGHVPGGLKIHVSGRVEQGSGGSYQLMGSGITINSFNLKQQLHEFVYNYELKFINGEVQLKDFELLEEDHPI